MAINLDLFSGSNFRLTMQNYCSQLGWRISDLNDRRAILKFNASSGNTQTLFIVRYENTLEFSVPSGLKFNSDSEIPGVFQPIFWAKIPLISWDFGASKKSVAKKFFPLCIMPRLA